jgi:hypothetical protein
MAEPRSAYARCWRNADNEREEQHGPADPDVIERHCRRHDQHQPLDRQAGHAVAY